MSLFNNIQRRGKQLAVASFTLACSLSAHASSTGLPWEDPLSKIVDSITGPVAFGGSVLGIVVAGLTLIFGGEMDGFVQKIMMIALIVSIIVGAVNLLTLLFGVSGALIA